MSVVLTIDPGVKHAGCALWEGGQLFDAWLDKRTKIVSLYDVLALSLDVRTLRDCITTVIVEKPEIRSRKIEKRNIKPESIVELAFSAGQLLRLAPHAAVHTPLASEWKGLVDPDVMLRRISERLDPEERSYIEWPKSKERRKDVLCAIGIGLWYYKRLWK